MPTGSELFWQAGEARVSGERVFVLELAPPPDRCVGQAVIVPPYGQSTHSLFLTAAYLAANGFRVLRFDARRHVGMSEGEIVDYTLSTLREDTRAVLGRLESLDRTVLVGFSLACPVVFHLLKDNPVAGAVTVVPVVDGGDTLVKAAGGTPIEPYRQHRPNAPELVEIFGYAVRAQPFVDDMDGSGYGYLRDTLATVTAAQKPLHVIAARNDEYVDFAMTEKLAAILPTGSQFRILNEAGHELGRSIVATKRVMRELVKLALDLVAAQRESEVNLPRFTEIIRLSSEESNLLTSASKDA